MNPRAQQLIETLRLQPHPEGGYYRETHRSTQTVAAHGGQRAAVTSILFLLPAGQRSRPHRVKSDEVWMHHQGDDLLLRIGNQTVVLGQDAPAHFQATVPADVWQSAEPLDGPHGFVLVGCVVAPGFDFQDFEMEED